MRQVSLGMLGLTVGGALCLGLGGCSGAGKFFRDTGLAPGLNPNDVQGSGETLALVHGRGVATPPLMPEPGNVWPGPPKPFPTLQDVAAHPAGGAGGYNPLLGNVPGHGGQDALAPGQSLSMGANDFSGVGGSSLDVPNARSAPLPAMPTVPRTALPSSGQAGGRVVIPNGDGTQTVINPDGTVSTVKVPR